MQFIINLNVAHVLVKRLNTCIWMSHTGSQSEMIKDIDVHLQNTLKKIQTYTLIFFKILRNSKGFVSNLKKKNALPHSNLYNQYMLKNDRNI